MVYVNGTLFGEPVSVNVTDLDTAHRSGTTLRLGGIGGQTVPYNGCIAELQIWRTARNREEIQANLFQTLEAGTPNLVGNIRDHTEGNTANPDDTCEVQGNLISGDALLVVYPTWGTVFTFDMHPKIETSNDWQARIFRNNTMNLLEVLDLYGIKATFMVSGFDYVAVDWSWFTLLNDIVARGHELGMHTKDHKGFEPYWTQQWIIDWYTTSQVFCNYSSYNQIRNSNIHNAGHWPQRPRSFAFPNTTSNWLIDSKLLHYFSHLRGSNGRSGPIPVGDLAAVGTIAGGWIDRETFGKYPDLKAVYLIQISALPANGQVLTFGGHIPTTAARATWTSNPADLEDIMQAVANNPTPVGNAPFLRLDDLPSYYGWQNLEARCW